MDTSSVQVTTRILTAFVATEFAANVLEVFEPAHQGSSYRWRIVSNRYKEVTVVVATKKSLFAKPVMSSIEVYGLVGRMTLKPNVKALQDYLGRAELSAFR